jgi:metal-responsive CopG/Arc/MetJ family transcriptional regulator
MTAKKAPTKAITIRLPDDLLARVDAVVETGFDNRSDALRTLIETGIDKDALDARIQEMGQDIDEKLTRMMHVVEMLYQLTYINTSATLDGHEALKAKIPALRAGANQELATAMIEKFGE